MKEDMERVRMVIRHFADYVLLDSCAYQSAGFYNGQAGVALALFESARMLDDSFLEEQAFNLFQKSLLSQDADMGFQEGWAGIGFVLAYLSHYRFIDTDLDELLKKRIYQICGYIEDGINKHRYMVQDIALGFFMNFLTKQCGWEEMESLRYGFYKSVESQILCALEAYEMKPNQNFRMSFPDLFVTYLELSRFDGFYERENIIEMYGRISGKHSAIHSFYIEQTGGWNGKNKRRTLYEWPMLLRGLPLKHFMNVLHLLLIDKVHNIEVSKWIAERLINQPLDEIEKELLSHLHPKMLLSGYGDGVSRFLLLLCQLMGECDKMDMGRMNCLFKP